MRSLVTRLLILSVVLAAASIGDAAARGKEPEVIEVQHILIGFSGSVPNKEIDRTRKEAKNLAYDLIDRAEAGEDFAALVEEYTDDSAPGIYRMTNDEAPAQEGAYRRRDMATSFGDIAFRLEVGEFGLAKHHAELSPFGYHIIKRLE